MATNGNQETFAPDDVLAAVMTMRGGEQESKKKAHEYLERFQKSVRGFIHGIVWFDMLIPIPCVEWLVGYHSRHSTVGRRPRGNSVRCHHPPWQG